jgi:DNA-binding CsgD family transcriptional regulator
MRLAGRPRQARLYERRARLALHHVALLGSSLAIIERAYASIDSYRAEHAEDGGSTRSGEPTTRSAQPLPEISLISANRGKDPPPATTGGKVGSVTAAAKTGLIRSEGTVSSLTPREREVLALIARGYTNRQIADELVVTGGTAANHVQHILAKLKCHNRTELVVRLLGSAAVDEPSTDGRSRDAS